MALVNAQPNVWLLSGHSANGATGSAIDVRAGRGMFVITVSGSAGESPAALTGGASATFSIQHSPNLTAWTTLATQTASSPGVPFSTWFSAGTYGYIRASAVNVYSAAQTGTGVLFVHLLGGV